MRLVVVALMFLGLTSSARAMNGGEFLQLPEAFGEGYAFGVLEVQLGFYDAARAELQGRQRNCFIGTGLTSDILYRAVFRHIEGDASALLEPAFVAVVKTLAEMCPAPK